MEFLNHGSNFRISSSMGDFISLSEINYLVSTSTNTAKMKKLLLAISILSFATTFGQSNNSELELLIYAIDSSGSYYNTTYGNNSRFIKSKKPISLLGGVFMFTYQNVISPQLLSSCSYSLSCSNYSKQCISEFGFIKGVFLSADRLLRCNAAYSSEHMHTTDFDLFIDPPSYYKAHWKALYSYCL